MSLKAWADNGWLRPHQTSEKEITNLLGIVERDFADVQERCHQMALRESFKSDKHPEALNTIELAEARKG